jgi:hypothetical protein
MKTVLWVRSTLKICVVAVPSKIHPKIYWVYCNNLHLQNKQLKSARI